MGEWPPLSVKIKGDIPPASGLGSSAALSVAAAGALRCARGRQLIGDDWAEGFSAANPNNVYQGPWKNNAGGSVLKGDKSVDADECAILAHAVEAHAQGGELLLSIPVHVHMVDALFYLTKLKVDWIGFTLAD